MAEHAGKYAYLDQLPTEQLQTLLRADFESLEPMNEEAISYILDLLVQRDQQDPNGQHPDVEQAWQEFQQYYNIPEGAGQSLYAPLEQEPAAKPEKRHVRWRSVLTRVLVAVIAVAVLLMTAQAAGLNVFGTLTKAQWDDEVVNDRGWIMGTDNRRINIYADNDAKLMFDGVNIKERGDDLLADGCRIGTVWSLGESGRKMYALYNGNYKLVASGDIKIEYMDSGYFDKVVEYTTGSTSATFHISDYSSMEINCTTKTTEIQPAHVYTAAELEQLNAN